MTVLNVLGWKLEVDRETTEAFSRSAPFLTVPCDCGPCRNYIAALEHFPPALAQLLRDLGTAPDKAAEIWYGCPNADGTHLYGGIIHFTGNILAGQDVPAKTQSDFERLSSDVWVSFTSSQGPLIHMGFPSPVVEVEFQVNLPWVLTEAPPFPV